MLQAKLVITYNEAYIIKTCKIYCILYTNIYIFLSTSLLRDILERYISQCDIFVTCFKKELL
jgi:hypothetical protein